MFDSFSLFHLLVNPYNVPCKQNLYPKYFFLKKYIQNHNMCCDVTHCTIIPYRSHDVTGATDIPQANTAVST